MRATRIATCTALTLATSAAVNAQAINLDFNDNAVPAGWTLHATTVATDFGFAGGRFYADGGAGSGAYIEHVMNFAPGTSSVQVGWEGSVFQTYWGNFSSVKFKDLSGNLFVTSIGSASYNWGSGMQVLLQAGGGSQSWLLPMTSGSYTFQSTFTAGQITFVGTLNGSEVFSKTLAAPTLDLAAIEAVRLHVYETVGPRMWIDNVTISAVPELPVHVLLLAGLPLMLWRRRVARH